MKKDNLIKIDKIYLSQSAHEVFSLEFDMKNRIRPSWIKVALDKKVIFIKILVNNESFWYRRYFHNYFFPLENNSEDIRNLYDAIAGEYENFVPQEKEMIEFLLRLFNELGVRKNNKILDLGSGTGVVTAGLAKVGYSNLTLLDISLKELDVARAKKELKSAIFIKCDLTKDKISEKYDIIFETMSMNEFKENEMSKILKKIKSALSIGGRLIIIDRHIYPVFKKFFKELKSGKFELVTPEGKFDYYYFVGEK